MAHYSNWMTKDQSIRASMCTERITTFLNKRKEKRMACIIYINMTRKIILCWHILEYYTDSVVDFMIVGSNEMKNCVLTKRDWKVSNREIVQSLIITIENGPKLHCHWKCVCIYLCVFNRISSARWVIWLTGLNYNTF